MKKHVTVLLIVSSAILLLAGCGGGGGGSNPCTGSEGLVCFQEWDQWMADILNPPTSSNLVDTYTLLGFDVNICMDGDRVDVFDENDVLSWSGNMDIQATTITQNVTVEGDSTLVSGNYTVSAADTTSGTFNITGGSGSYDIDFSISGNVLTTDSGLVCIGALANQASIEPLEAGEDNGVGSLLGDLFMY